MDGIWWTLQSILPYLLAGGVSVGSIFLYSKKKRKEEAELTLTTVEAWRQIAEINSKALMDRNDIIIKQNEKILELELSIQTLNANVKKLENILSQIIVCRHYTDCPVRVQLQDYKRIAVGGRKHAGKRAPAGDAAACSCDGDGAEGVAGRHHVAAAGGDVRASSEPRERVSKL